MRWIVCYLFAFITAWLYSPVALKDRDTAARKMVSQANHLAVMGKSLAAVAHDMRSPLMLIGGFARRILKKMDDHDPASLKLALIIQETEKMERMTGDMLDFSKPLTLMQVRGNINTTVRNALAKVQEAARKKKVSVEYKSNPEPADIKFDNVRFEQIIVNLVHNAVEASPRRDSYSHTAIFIPRKLILDVVDNGNGIPLSTRQQVFDPFLPRKRKAPALACQS